MDKEGVTVKKTTTYLLKEIAKNTNNQSLNTNIELALSNIKLGAQIAKKL